MSNNNVLGLVSVSCATAAGYMVKSKRCNTIAERVSLGFLGASSLVSLYYLTNNLLSSYYKRKSKNEDTNTESS